MKTQIKRFSKSTLAVVLTLCMLFSCVTVGIVATNAAIVSDSGAVAAKTDSESVGSNKTIYINTEKWGDDVSTVAYYAWAWTTGQNGAWYDFTASSESHYYEMSVPDSVDNYIFFRAKNDMEHGWTENTNYWNKTGDVSGESGKNCYTFSKYSTGTWGTYTPVASHTINYTQPTGGTVDTSGSLTSAREGAEVTLTNSPAYGYVFSSYTVTKHGDSSTPVTVSNGKFIMPAYDVDVTATFAENTSMTFYAAGRFETSTANTGSSWDTTSTNIPFTHSGEFDWIVDTGKTLKDYTGGYSLNTNNPVYLKVYDGNTVFGANYTFTDNDTSTALTGGSDYSVAFNSQNDNGTVVLHFDPRSKTLSYTLSAEEQTYAATAKLGDTTHATWSDTTTADKTVTAGSYTGVALPTVTPAAGYKFNGWTVTNNGSGTVTLVNADKNDGTAKVKATAAGGIVTANIVEKDAPITIYVCDNKPLVTNAANLCFYTFHGTTTGATGAWPGCTVATAQNDHGSYTTTTVGTIDSKTVYKLELDPDDFAADTGIIINGSGNQTSDLTLADGQIYFTKTENNVAGSQDVFDQSMLDNAAQRYVIAGTKGLVGSDPWSTTSHIMKYNSNGTYTITFNNVAASPEYGTLAFKVIKYNSNWVTADYTDNANNVAIESNADHKKIDDSGNIAFTTTKKSNVTITYNPNVTTTNVVTISAADIPATNLTTTFYVDKDNVNGLYVWTDSGAEPLGTWSETDSNVSSIDTIERPTGYNSGSYVKLTFNSSDSTFKYIVKKGTDKSADSASYPIGGTYVIGSITNVPTVLGGGGGGSNTDAKWDAIFDDANKVPSEKRNKYLLKSNNAVPNSTNFTSTDLDAYVSDGKIYFKIPYATVSANKYFMLVGTDNDYTSDWYQITNNSGNSITNVFVDTSASEYLTAAKKECYGQDEGHTNTNYFYSQVNIQEGAENTFSNVVLEIDPAQSKRTFTYYTYGATPIAKMPKVVVENGSYGYQSKYGTATVTTPSGLAGTPGTWWTTYRVEEGTQLYITTTIKSNYRGDGTDSGMYVAAYAVNGVKYDVEQSGNSYTFVNSKPITVGTEDIEITPVYYSRSIEKNNDYITIYVEADSELIDHWGDQIYVYSYYYITGQTEGRIDGNYPGQTLALDASGYYVGKIAKYNYTGDYLQTKEVDHPVSGVTFSGGYENNAPHHNFIDYAQNRQTYDYDDFKYIANLGYDTVRLDLKYTPQTTDSNQHMLINNANNHPATTANTPASTGYDVSKVQGYEYLYDFDYNPCSVLGLSQKVARDFGGTWNDADPYGTNHKVKIISVGNQNYSGTGEWSTYWYVYRNTGTSESLSGNW